MESFVIFLLWLTHPRPHGTALAGGPHLPPNEVGTLVACAHTPMGYERTPHHVSNGGPLLVGERLDFALFGDEARKLGRIHADGRTREIIARSVGHVLVA